MSPEIYPSVNSIMSRALKEFNGEIVFSVKDAEKLKRWGIAASHFIEKKAQSKIKKSKCKS